jgi:hypothetical protein
MDLSQLNEETISKISEKEYRDLQLHIDKIRWTKTYNHPENMYWPVFADMPSKRKGDLWEKMYQSACVSLNERQDKWHDATLDLNICSSQKLKGIRVEIKYGVNQDGDHKDDIDVRGYNLELGNRARTVKQNEKSSNGWDILGGGAFLQVHPKNAHYGLFTTVFANGAVHYWVPYHLVSNTAGSKNTEPGKIPLSSQHDGGVVEGQITRTKRFHELFFLDVTLGTPFITDLSKYDLSKFENLVY